MAEIHGSPGDAPQMPAAPNAGPAPAPYGGARPGEPPQYGAAPFGLVDVAADIMAPYPAGMVAESAMAHEVSAGAPDAPYYPGPLFPVDAAGDADPGGRDVVAGTVAGSVAAATARLGELQGDTYGLGSTIGDLMTFPPSPLDPGAVGGLKGGTDPSGAFYDPPRGGAPETYIGNEPN